MSFPARAHGRRRFKRSFFRRRSRFGHRRSFGRFKTRARRTDYVDTFGAKTSTGIRPLGRRLRPRQWRRIIFRDTLAQSHWRSDSTVTGAVATGGTAGQGPITYDFPLGTGTTLGSITGFWLAANGTQPINAAGDNTVPHFKGDITIRGGYIFAMLGSIDANQVVHFKVYLIITNPLPQSTGLAANASTQLDSYDPTIGPNFKDWGRLVATREGMISGGATQRFTWRLKPQKINQYTFAQGGKQPFFLVHIINTTGTATENVQLTTGFNLSFSADASATTGP